MRLREELRIVRAEDEVFSSPSATRTATTAGLGTRAFLGSTRSAHTQTKAFALPLFRTEKAKRSSTSLLSGSDSAIRRTSSRVATRSPLAPNTTTVYTMWIRGRELPAGSPVRPLVVRFQNDAAEELRSSEDGPERRVGGRVGEGKPVGDGGDRETGACVELRRAGGLRAGRPRHL